jgi:hypothetical protein
MLSTWLRPYLNPAHNRYLQAVMWGILLQLFGALLCTGDLLRAGKQREAVGAWMILAGVLFPLVPILTSREVRRLFAHVRQRAQSGDMRDKLQRVSGAATLERGVAWLERLVADLDDAERLPRTASVARELGPAALGGDGDVGGAAKGVRLVENPVLQRGGGDAW